MLDRALALFELVEQLPLVHEDAIGRLSNLAEFRDPETAEHLQRMSRYCELLACQLGLSAQRCEDIRLASLLHDVGKIGIADSILLKPGKLTAAEFDEVKKHSEIGYLILSGTPSHVLQLGAIVAWTHHEKFDGSGYPRGLTAGDIPLEGRIAAVADVFDALTSRRVYKSAMAVDEAVGILQHGRKAHFDPTLVDFFVRAMNEVCAIRRHHGG